MAAVANLSANLALNSTQFESGMRRSDRLMSRTSANMNKKFKSIDHSAQGSFKRAAQSVAAFQGPLGAVSGRLSTMASIASTSGLAIGGIGVAITGAALAFKKAVNVGEEFEQSQLRIAGLLKATAGASGQTAEGIREFSRTLARETLAGTMEVEKAAGILLTFRSVAGDTFKRTLTLAQDLASAGFGNLATNALQLGKALQDPVLGLTSLARSGVTFTQTQKDVIKALVETGDAAQAQTLILDELEKQVGGTGAAAGAGLSGAYDSLSQSIGEFFEALNKATGAGEGFATMLGHIDSGLQNLNENLNPELIPIDQRIVAENAKLLKLMDERAQILAGNRAAGLSDDSAISKEDSFQIDEQIKKQNEIVDSLIKQAQAQAKKAEEAKKAAEAVRIQTEAERKQAAVSKEANKLKEEADKLEERRAAKVASIIEGMEHEAAIRGKTAEQIEVMNALKRADIDMTEIIITQQGELVGVYEEEAAAIAELAVAKVKYNEAQEAANEAKKKDEELTRRGTQVTNENRTAQEEYNDTMKELRDLLLAGKIDTETYSRAQTEAMEEMNSSLDKYSQKFGTVFDQLANDLARGELSWKSFANVAIKALIDIAEEALNIGSMGGGIGGGLLSGLFSGIGSIFGGGGMSAGSSDFTAFNKGGFHFPQFAAGGNPPVGSPYIVGENGPELRIDRTPGTIIPNGGFGGGQTIAPAVTFNVSPGVQGTVQSELKAMLPEITERVKRAVQDAVQRGGSYSRDFGA